MSDSGTKLLDLRTILAGLREALVPTLGPELTFHLSLPVTQQIQAQPEERGVPGVIVSLGCGAGPECPSAWLWLDAAFASNLVDRALGGRGQLGIATTAALPSDAECGVLAYLAARTVRDFEGLWIRDVYATKQTPASTHLIWPVSVRFSGGSGIARFAWPMSPTLRRLPTQIGWLDTLSSADLAALEVGDVLISDGQDDLPLSATTQGLSAYGVLGVEGINDRLRVALDGAQLHGLGQERVKTRTDELFVVLHELPLTTADLATLTCGGHITLPTASALGVQLKRGDLPIAQGELVQIGSAIGVRIRALSQTSQRV